MKRRRPATRAELVEFLMPRIQIETLEDDEVVGHRRPSREEVESMLEAIEAEGGVITGISIEVDE